MERSCRRRDRPSTGLDEVLRDFFDLRALLATFISALACFLSIFFTFFSMASLTSFCSLSFCSGLLSACMQDMDDPTPGAHLFLGLLLFDPDGDERVLLPDRLELEEGARGHRVVLGFRLQARASRGSTRTLKPLTVLPPARRVSTESSCVAGPAFCSLEKSSKFLSIDWPRR